MIPYLRRYHQTDYVFLVNDRREYGQYVGQHGLVMENGLPSQAVVAINRPGGFVYDLVGGRQVAATAGERPPVGRRRPRPVRRPAIHGLVPGGRSGPH